jgi:hypothetical protein
MAAKKDFSAINTGRVAAAIETGTSTKGRQTTASKEEQAQRAAAHRTQGRKGCKLDGQRINLLLSTENHDFIKVMARATGRSMTELCNDIITAYRNEHPEFMEKAADFLDFVNSGRFSNKKKGRK